MVEPASKVAPLFLTLARISPMRCEEAASGRHINLYSKAPGWHGDRRLQLGERHRLPAQFVIVLERGERGSRYCPNMTVPVARVCPALAPDPHEGVTGALVHDVTVERDSDLASDGDANRLEGMWAESVFNLNSGGSLAATRSTC